MSSKRNPPPPPPPKPLLKQHSWSPDAYREDAWRSRRKKEQQRSGRSKSVTDEDLEELKGCIELGFGFEPNSPELDPRLSETLPALGLYCAVNRQYSNRLSRTSSLSSIVSEGEVSNSSSTIVDLGDDPETRKMRIKQWAAVVACSVRQLAGEANRSVE